MCDTASQMLADEEMAAFLKMKYVVDSGGKQGKVSLHRAFGQSKN